MKTDWGFWIFGALIIVIIILNTILLLKRVYR